MIYDLLLGLNTIKVITLLALSGSLSQNLIIRKLTKD
jgi:hypothetical protein